ncbi:MAG: hypothetical protein MUQ30_11535 [Anaerolineae bacterium]|nr:hypothetical protein [Anaerolineae bacterium]
MDGQALNLRGRVTAGGHIQTRRPNCRRLSIPEGPGDRYRVAQLDDYGALPRSHFRWAAPIELRVTARVSAPNLPGTWGFGWWNDPFSMQLGLGGATRRLPALPNAAWVFYAAPPNYLALRDDHPAQGLLAATFSSPQLSAPLLALGLPAVPLLMSPCAARAVRRVARWFVREDAAVLSLDPTQWHTYGLLRTEDLVRVTVDGVVAFSTPVVPNGRLGLVLWIDNQYVAFPPDGRLRIGSSANPDAWLDVADLSLSRLTADLRAIPGRADRPESTPPSSQASSKQRR